MAGAGADQFWIEVLDKDGDAVTLSMDRDAVDNTVTLGGGNILSTGSIGTFKGFPNHPAYCATKGALVPLTKVMALDYAKDGIRVNCICPGQIDTPLLWDSAEAFPDPETIIQEVTNRIPLKRLGTPEDIARFALFLVSDHASWVTGQHFTVDGGIMAGGG